MKFETLQRLRAQAEADADREAYLVHGDREGIEAAIRAAYLRGADAGYTARVAEERK